MDTVNILTAIISSIVGAATSIGGVFLFYPQNKRNKEIANQSLLMDQWEKLYSISEETQTKLRDLIHEKDNKITSLYSSKDVLRTQNISLLEEKASLEVSIARRDVEIASLNEQITKLKYNQCLVDDCPERKPKRKVIQES